MKSIFRAGALRAYTTRRERLLLAALALLTVSLAAAFPSYPPPAPSWLERDFGVHFQAQQLFGRNAEELSEAELSDVRRWGRMIGLTSDYPARGIDHLSNADCHFVMDTLDDLCPRLEKHAGYQLIYRSCAARLAGSDQSSHQRHARQYREISPYVVPR